jgi:hypothetical protein
MILEYVSNALEVQVQNLTINCGCRCGKTLELSQSVGPDHSTSNFKKRRFKNSRSN